MLPQNYILPPKTDEWTTDTLRIRFKLFKLHLFAFFPTISFPVAEFPKSSPRLVWQKTSEPQLECCECSQPLQTTSMVHRPSQAAAAAAMLPYKGAGYAGPRYLVSIKQVMVTLQTKEQLTDLLLAFSLTK